MEQSVFKLKLRSRYCIILMIIFDMIINIIGWLTYEMRLFYYQECSFSMKGNSVCNGNTINKKCFAETDQECDYAFTIVATYFIAILCPAIYQAYCLLVFFIQCCFCKRQNFGFAKFNLYLKIIFYSFSAALFFYTTSYVIELGKTDVSLNGQISTACIALGILCFLTTLCEFYMIYELYFLNEIANIVRAQENNFEKQRTNLIISLTQIFKQSEQLSYETKLNPILAIGKQ
ncbi:hypothetical protein pb186bvf_003134 [Paramecium bursaria]